MHGSKVIDNNRLANMMIGLFSILSLFYQVAITFLVAGSTPTFWIPQFVSTSS